MLAVPSRRIYALVEKDVLSEDDPMQEKQEMLTMLEHCHALAVNQNHEGMRA